MKESHMKESHMKESHMKESHMKEFHMKEWGVRTWGTQHEFFSGKGLMIFVESRVVVHAAGKDHVVWG